MTDKRAALETLRLLKAFFRITDADHRREVIELAEKYAASSENPFR
jgi:hypothetical protein